MSLIISAWQSGHCRLKSCQTNFGCRHKKGLAWSSISYTGTKHGRFFQTGRNYQTVTSSVPVSVPVLKPEPKPAIKPVKI